MLRKQPLTWSLIIGCAALAIACSKKKENCTKVGTGSDGKPIMQCSGGGSTDAQKAVLTQWVEGYARWSSLPSNQNQWCPDPLTAQNVAHELEEHVNSASPVDKWGHELVFYCGQNVPPGVHTGFAVKSLGPDGVDQQSGGDDLRSWD